METAASCSPCAPRVHCEARQAVPRPHAQPPPPSSAPGESRAPPAQPRSSLPARAQRAPRGRAVPGPRTQRGLPRPPRALRVHIRSWTPSHLSGSVRVPFGAAGCHASPLCRLAGRRAEPAAFQSPPASSKPLPRAGPGPGTAPRPEAHERRRHVSVQEGSAEGARTHACEKPSRTSPMEADLLRLASRAPVPRDDTAPSITVPAQPPKRPFLCGLDLTWNVLGSQTSRPEAARGWPPPEAVRWQVRATRRHENTCREGVGCSRFPLTPSQTGGGARALSLGQRWSDGQHGSCRHGQR